MSRRRLCFYIGVIVAIFAVPISLAGWNRQDSPQVQAAEPVQSQIQEVPCGPKAILLQLELGNLSHAESQLHFRERIKVLTDGKNVKDIRLSLENGYIYAVVIIFE